MGEKQVSLDGITHPLPNPFFVIATQNPVEHRGVNDLPEAQLDRFQMVLSLGYATAEEEKRLTLARQQGDPLEKLAPVMSVAQLRDLLATILGANPSTWLTMPSPWSARRGNPSCSKSAPARAASSSS
jgi:MoxR-like ATPase